MFTHNEQIKARFPLSLDGRGVRGESLAVLFLLAMAWLMMPSAALAQTSCDDAVFPAEMTCTPDGDAVILDNDDADADGIIDLSAVTGGYIFNNNTGAVWDTGFSGGQVGNLGEGEFNNAGTVKLRRGDIISAAGSTFNGLGGAVLELQSVVLDGQGQSSCASPTIAICLDLTGGTTTGQTAIRIVAFKDDAVTTPLTKTVDKFLSPGIVLVDVGGGASQADHFVLSSDSFERRDLQPGPGSDIVNVPFYEEDAKYGAVLDTGGLFDYALLYNPDTQQHILASVPQHEGVEYVALADEALSVWHTTSEAVVGRQADLRAGAERGGWVRIVSESKERDSAPVLTTHGNTFTYDQDYTLDTDAVIAGVDVTSAKKHVIGLHAGVLSGRVNFDDSGTHDRIKGVTVGAYGGWWNEAGLTVDAAFNANFIPKLKRRVPDQETSTSNVKSYGVRAEAGWRMAVSDNFYVQPLASVAYVKADIDRLELKSYDMDFENTESARAALGVRLGGGTQRLEYWLTARAWEESAGDDAQVRYKVVGGDDLVIEDDISGSFEEVGLGVDLAVDDKLSVFLSGNGKFGDETDSHNVTIGARLNW